MTSIQYRMYLLILKLLAPVLVYLSLALDSNMSSHAQSSKTSDQNIVTQITADEAQWNWKLGKLNAKGKVTLKYDFLTISCDQAEVTFDQAKQGIIGDLKDLSTLSLRRVVAEGQVKVLYKKLTLKAHRIVYRHVSQVLRVDGQLSGQWGDHTLGGRDLVIELNKDMAKVQKINIEVTWPTTKMRQGVFDR